MSSCNRNNRAPGRRSTSEATTTTDMNADARYDLLPPHEAFNYYLHSSVILLDCCKTREAIPAEPEAQEAPMFPLVPDASAALPALPDDSDAIPALPSSWQGERDTSTAAGRSADGMMPGSAWLDAALPLLEAATLALQHNLDNLTPDDTSQALVLFDDPARAQQLAAWLTERGLRRVMASDRDALQRSHPFLLYPGALSLVLPNEIVPGRLYLGGAATANADALRLLHISAVISLVDRELAPPDDACVRHLLLRIADARSADMDGALLEALPFLEEALAEPGGRILIHCEAGQSRSATVVVAAIMANVGQLASFVLPPAATMRCACAAAAADDDDDTEDATTGGGMSVTSALLLVRAQRPCIRPNDGFLACLRRAAWMPQIARSGRGSDM